MTLASRLKKLEGLRPGAPTYEGRLQHILAHDEPLEPSGSLAACLDRMLVQEALDEANPPVAEPID